METNVIIQNLIHFGTGFALLGGAGLAILGAYSLGQASVKFPKPSDFWGPVPASKVNLSAPVADNFVDYAHRLEDIVCCTHDALKAGEEPNEVLNILTQAANVAGISWDESLKSIVNVAEGLVEVTTA